MGHRSLLLQLLLWSWQQHVTAFVVQTPLHASRLPTSSSLGVTDDDEEELLHSVQIPQLVGLCEQLDLDATGSKDELLQRLRGYAEQQAVQEQERLSQRNTRVENSQNPKERHEIVRDDPSEPDEEGFFFFEDPNIIVPQTNNDGKETQDNEPPPPKSTQQQQDQRVETIYSTTNQNDLTALGSADVPTNGISQTPQPWDFENTKTLENSPQELERARETVSDLVVSLLAATGAPGFVQMMDDDDDTRISPTGTRFDGFDPARVPTERLSRASRALRAQRGGILEGVLQELELRAVGYDGAAGDDTENGGGHFRELTKIRAFLEGYRQAETRRVARETATLLLEKVILEGVEGLDQMLRTMVRTTDDTWDAGVLNDSLLDFLNDAIRDQERKVGDLKEQQLDGWDRDTEEEDDLWDISNEDGEQVETLDPNNPQVKRALAEEIENEPLRATLPDSAPERSLLLLKLLRDRIKTEAAFGADEKGKNLRLLAYCLQVESSEEQAQFILNEIGASFDQLDSFVELVESSIEYSESTSYELMPAAKSPILQVSKLKRILSTAQRVRNDQAQKASRLTP